MRFSDDRGFLCASGSDSIFAIVRFGPELHHSGKRKDRERGAVPGATIILSGTQQGVTTDAQGNFPCGWPKARRGCVAPRLLPGLQVPDPAHRQPHVVRHRAPGGEHLDGRSGRRATAPCGKKDLTGSLSSIGGEAILNRQTLTISQALQGAMPGVTVTRTNSAPGGSATIRIRGITSMTDGASDPYVLIDGVAGLDRRRKSQRHREHHRPERRRIGFDLRFSGCGGRHPDHHQAGRQVGRERHL